MRHNTMSIIIPSQQIQILVGIGREKMERGFEHILKYFLQYVQGKRCRTNLKQLDMTILILD